MTVGNNPDKKAKEADTGHCSCLCSVCTSLPGCAGGAGAEGVVPREPRCLSSPGGGSPLTPGTLPTALTQPWVCTRSLAARLPLGLCFAFQALRLWRQGFRGFRGRSLKLQNLQTMERTQMSQISSEIIQLSCQGWLAALINAYILSRLTFHMQLLYSLKQSRTSIVKCIK